MTDPRSMLRIVPCDLLEANEFVKHMHRHHKPMPTHKFSLAVVDDAEVVRGVAIVARPAARMLDDGWTLEVARLATDECPNACSALYGAAWRTARAMGYRRMTTYILSEEPGMSLRGAGWVSKGDAGGGYLEPPQHWKISGGQSTDYAEGTVGGWHICGRIAMSHFAEMAPLSRHVASTISLGG